VVDDEVDEVVEVDQFDEMQIMKLKNTYQKSIQKFLESNQV
jgi:hypothetical protein